MAWLRREGLGSEGGGGSGEFGDVELQSHSSGRHVAGFLTVVGDAGVAGGDELGCVFLEEFPEVVGESHRHHGIGQSGGNRYRSCFGFLYVEPGRAVIIRLVVSLVSCRAIGGFHCVGPRGEVLVSREKVKRVPVAAYASVVGVEVNGQLRSSHSRRLAARRIGASSRIDDLGVKVHAGIYASVLRAVGVEGVGAAGDENSGGNGSQPR